MTSILRFPVTFGAGATVAAAGLAMTPAPTFPAAIVADSQAHKATVPSAAVGVAS